VTGDKTWGAFTVKPYMDPHKKKVTENGSLRVTTSPSKQGEGFKSNE